MLYNGGTKEFEQTYSSFGVELPGITLLLLSNIGYWWAMLSASVSLGLLVAAVYLPALQMGQVV